MCWIESDQVYDIIRFFYEKCLVNKALLSPEKTGATRKRVFTGDVERGHTLICNMLKLLIAIRI